MYEILKDSSIALQNDYFKQKLELIPLIISSVDKSTIRSFQSKKGYVKRYKPLSIYRTWAFEFLTNEANLSLIIKKGDFHSLRNVALEDLMNFWHEKDKGEPKFYHFNKLIDLFFKCLPLWNKLDDSTSQWIFQNTNVPLDKFSLRVLKLHAELNSIPNNASMNHINEHNYKEFQDEIKKLCRDLPVIIFDLYAWNQAHLPPKKFILIDLEKKD